MVFISIFSIILLVGICILLLNISISIEFINVQENEKFIVSVSVLKKLLKFDISFIDTDRKEKKEEKEVNLSFSKTKDLVVKGYNQYSRYKEILAAMRKYIKNKLICKRLMFHLDFGLGDAALTGMTSGIVWGTCYNILAIIDNNCILEETDIKINPEFNDLKMDIKLYCIFRLRIVHIIIIFFILLWSLIKMLFNNKIFLKQQQIKHKAV